ncbi:MAG: DUF2288 domain-containing protein [Trichlorobacter sp.]|nr:DUF2288 domain-containing protein [Trichlorobacter sp.]
MPDDAMQGLAEQVDTAQWQWLRAHNERGALILVEGMLELVEVGERLVADDSTAVQSWLASQLLSKPTAEQIAIWNAEPDKLFSMLVVSPFVLIQEQLAAENGAAAS